CSYWQRSSQAKPDQLAWFVSSRRRDRGRGARSLEAGDQREGQPARVAVDIGATAVGAGGEEAGDRLPVGVQHAGLRVDQQSALGEGYGGPDLDQVVGRRVERGPVVEAGRPHRAGVGDDVAGEIGEAGGYTGGV